MQLTGRVALVTGGKRIGAVVATELARRGMDVGLAYYQSHEEAEETAAAVRALGRRANVVRADLRNAPECTRAVEETVAALGRLDVLLNMASIYREKPFDDLTDRDWETQIAVDLGSSFFCSRAAVPHMRRQGSGRIVNFTDWVAQSGRPRYLGFLPYYVAKAGVIALTEALALELAKDQILVNAIAPGPILAPEHTSEDERQKVEQATPLGRWGGGIEVAKVVLMFVYSDFITGETVRVDGGRHLK